MLHIHSFLKLTIIIYFSFTILACKTSHVVSQNNTDITFEQFGAKGDGATDDTKAILTAIKEAASQGKKLSIGSGKYVLNQPIIIPYNSAMVFEGINSEHSIIMYSGPKTRSVIEYEGGFLILKNFRISGNHANEYGFYSEKITYSQFQGLRVFNCSTAGLAIGYGWCNSFRDCLIQQCYDGIRFVSGECNSTTIDHCTFLDLKGIGLNMYATSNRAVKLSNCVFESIKKAGIFINASFNIDIDNCYFESSAIDGYKFNNHKLIKANIIINGAGNDYTAAHAYPTVGVCVHNCFISPGDEGYFIFSFGANGLSIVDNGFVAGKKISALGISGNQSLTYNKNVIVRNNQNAFKALDVIDSDMNYKLNIEHYEVKE